MKKYISLLICILSLLCLYNATNAATETITCSNVEEFIEALGSDRTIILKNDTYNLSAHLNKNAGTKALPEYIYGAYNTPGIYVYDEFDGYELILVGINNLTIRSETPSVRAEIVCEPRYADVLQFEGCENVLLENLVLGHTPEQGSCMGNVVDFSHCKNASVINCDLYGCGAYAFGLYESSGMSISDSIIHDCSYGAIDSFSSSMKFHNTEFTRCKEFAIFDLRDSDAEFVNCSMSKMIGDLFSLDAGSSAVLSNCALDKGCLDSLNASGLVGKSITVK